MRLLAAVPSVIYGLIGILAIAPWIERTPDQQRAQAVVRLRRPTQRQRPDDRDHDPHDHDRADHGRDQCQRARARSRVSWREGSAALGVNRWRTIWRVSLRTARPAIAAAVGARGRARPRRGDHARDGRRRQPVRRQPARRHHVPVRAGATARADDHHRNSAGRRAGRWHTRSTRSPRCCSSPPLCSRSRAGRPGSRSSATGSARDGRRDRARGRRRRRSAPPREGTASWPLVDRSVFWLCWATGIGLCLIAGAIVLFMFVKGVSYLRPALFVESPGAVAPPERVGRLP